MERLVAFAILACVTDVASAACAAPQKLSKWGVCKTSLTASCVQNDCCMEDPRKCKSLSVTCPTDKFKDQAKDNVNPSGLNSKDPATECCSSVEKCGTANCDARKKGLKNKGAPASATKCTSDAASCDETTCCESDTNKCGVGAANLGCTTADEYVNPATNMPDLAKNVRTNCCIIKAKCGSAPCISMKKGLKNKVAPASDTKCSSDAASCGESTCCESDETKCGVGAANLPCTTADEYVNPAANMPDLAKNVRTNCCLAKAMCASALCTTMKKGLKNKGAPTSNTKCSSNAASCGETCCEKDTTKCGVNAEHEPCTGTTIFKPGSEDANKSPANCCMEKMSCLALKSTITCITGWTEYDPMKDGDLATATSKNTKCCKDVTAWNKCPAPETKTTGTSGGSTGGSGSGGGGGTVGSPSGLDKLKPLTCWRVALLVIMMVSFRG